MLCFPNAKINIGLNVTSKRPDGYHNLESVFYPVAINDILEFIVDTNASEGHAAMTISGLAVDGPVEKNLVMKAYKLLHEQFKLPAIKIHLHKIIPMGAGLGGGSSDGAWMLKSLNDFFSLGLSTMQLRNYALQLGSDCAFFIDNQPAFVTGRGEQLSPYPINFHKLYLLLVCPGLHVSTAEAYSMLKPQQPATSLSELLQEPLENWHKHVVNDFEGPVFRKFPELAAIKTKLYDAGAVYASMSGSGSALYGIFNQKPQIPISLEHTFQQIIAL